MSTLRYHFPTFLANCETAAKRWGRTSAVYLGICLLGLAMASMSCGGGGGASTPPPPVVSVIITPSSNQSVVLGNTLQFAASVSGSSNTVVAWAVNSTIGGNSTVGTISTSGLYTAPADLPSPATVTVSATSQADSSKSASASVAVTSDITVSVASSPPGTTTANPGSTISLTATVNSSGKPDLTVNWSVNSIPNGNSTVGTISATGTDAATYTAPSAVPSPNPVTITASSVADPSKSGTDMLNIVFVSVAVSPSSPSLLLGLAQQFTATVSGTSNTAVTWSVNNVTGGNSTLGTISASGVYTAPKDLPSPSTLTITATSQADPTKSANAHATVTSDVSVSVVTLPGGVSSLVAGAVIQLVASISSVGSPDMSVIWSVNGIANGNSGVGTITTTSAGASVYTTPTSLPSSNPVTISAASVADPSKSASLMLTVNTAVPGTTLSTSALSFGNQAFQTTSPAQTILVTSSGTGPMAISSIAVSGTNSADFRQFNNCPGSSGALAAGAMCFINVRFAPSTTGAESATLTINNSGSGTPQTVALSGAGVGQAVAVTPTAATVESNFSVPFIQSVTGLSNTAVTWSVNGTPGGDFTVGTISGGGLYTAPASVPTPNTVTMTVTSQANSSLSASATVTIIPTAASVLVSPASASVQSGSREVVTAVVVDTSNTAVTWSVNSVANGNSVVGTIATSGAGANVATYTAPASSPVPNPVTITATSAADPTKSASASITITSGPGIVITLLDKTSLQPFNLLTITGAGFNPQASTTVNFSDSTGYSVTVPPVSVGASSVAVGIPPYISLSNGDFASGSVSVQVSQTLGSSTVASNTISGFQIQNLPTPAAPPGAVTLALLTAQRQFPRSLLSYLSFANPRSSFNTPEMNGALSVVTTVLDPLISEIYDVVQNPTHTFTLGVASGNTLTVGSSELAKADRMIVGMLSAQAAAGFLDAPEPVCQFGVSVVDPTALLNNQVGGPGPYAIGCVPFAATTAMAVVGGSAGVATGLGGLLFGAEATAAASAAVSGQLAYITMTLGLGLTEVGAALGQGSAYGQALVQAGAKIIEDYLKDAVKSAVVSRTLGETAGNLFDLAGNANELHHALESSPPYNGGAIIGSTNALSVSTMGTGSGTIVSFPGGVICGSSSFLCGATFTTGETVFLSAQPATGSIFQGFGLPCSGNVGCQLTMSADQSVSADFEPAPPPPSPITFTGSITGSVVDEGHGGCNGGAGGTASFTGTVTMTASQLSAGGYRYTGTINLSQGFGICDDYSGAYSFSGQVPSLNGGSTAFFFGPGFASGTFSNGNSFSGTWSFSVNVGPDVANGTMNLTSP